MGANFLKAPIKWAGVEIDPTQLREPVSELQVADHALFAKLLGKQASFNGELDNPVIIKGEE